MISAHRLWHIELETQRHHGGLETAHMLKQIRPLLQILIIDTRRQEPFVLTPFPLDRYFGRARYVEPGR